MINAHMNFEAASYFVRALRTAEALVTNSRFTFDYGNIKTCKHSSNVNRRSFKL